MRAKYANTLRAERFPSVPLSRVRVMTTVSLYRACAGGYVGSGHVHPALLDAAREAVSEAKTSALVRDGFVARCGADIGLVLLHEEPAGSSSIAALVRDVFDRAHAVGVRLAQFGVNGHALPVDGAELVLSARDSEPVLCFFSDKAGPGSWNVHLYRAFADPFNTPSLVTDAPTREGFAVDVVGGDRPGRYALPGDLYRFLAAAGREGARVTKVISTATGHTAAVASTGPDPVLIVRCGSPFPAVEEVLEAFTVAYAFGTTFGGPSPLVPVSANGDASSRSVGRAIGLGFQITTDRLIGPRDLLGDAAFDGVRRQAAAAADYLRRHGPFGPHRNGVDAPLASTPQL
jgi:fructose 1,6-bisphosphate aldolase/phosphatase